MSLSSLTSSDALILVINTGSSSIKMALLGMPSEHLIAEGMADRLGQPEASLVWQIEGTAHSLDLDAADHQSAIEKMFNLLFTTVDKSRIAAVGHRVVHGGERFVAPTLLDASVIAEIKSLSHLAPLHNPSNLLGIEAALTHLPAIPHIAIFDTAFHHGMPQHAYLYAVPYEWYSEHGVRRYGFHGTSHHYVAQQAAEMLGHKFEDCRLLTAHLGNGCSAAAISGGVSVDTTMGMTPLEGLVMGSRSGDVDPGLHDYMARESGSSLASITNTLNKASGLLGLSGLSNDMRTLLAAADNGDERAALAIDIFCYRLAKSLASLAVAVGGVDAIVFTGGIGEHAGVIRAKTVKQLALFGIKLDKEKNREHGKESGGFVTTDDSYVPVMVIATNEEKMIARYVSEQLNRKDRHA